MVVNLFLISDLVLSGSQVMMGLAVISAIVAGGILLYKRILEKQSQSILEQDKVQTGAAWERKHEEVSILRKNSTSRLSGGVIALATVLTVLGWTHFQTDYQLIGGNLEIPEDIILDPPPTAPKPKIPPKMTLPPPPTPSFTNEVKAVDEVVKEEDKKDESVDEDTKTSNTPSDYKGPTDEKSSGYVPSGLGEEPVEIDEEPKIEEIVDIAEQMPRFPGCEDQAGDDNAKKACADQRLLQYIYKTIKYPAMAREAGIEGLVVVSFVVAKDGSIKDAKVRRDIGGGCGKEALRVVKQMNKLPENWTPGKQRGRAVGVRYNLPVKFKLQ
ncbi:MAG: TonB family protein [Aureispira sp.]|nr:TonB family protein [Aureispira sp.]